MWIELTQLYSRIRFRRSGSVEKKHLIFLILLCSDGGLELETFNPLTKPLLLVKYALTRLILPREQSFEFWPRWYFPHGIYHRFLVLTMPLTGFNEQSVVQTMENTGKYQIPGKYQNGQKPKHWQRGSKRRSTQPPPNVNHLNIFLPWAWGIESSRTKCWVGWFWGSVNWVCISQLPKQFVTPPIVLFHSSTIIWILNMAFIYEIRTFECLEIVKRVKQNFIVHLKMYFIFYVKAHDMT
jgi:hypothetical protein